MWIKVASTKLFNETIERIDCVPDEYEDKRVEIVRTISGKRFKLVGERSGRVKFYQDKKHV